MKSRTHGLVQAFAVAGVVASSLVWLTAQQGGTIAIDPDDIAGVVRSLKGPEAGVWVIAETTGLPTKFARIVVTDDQGRYVVPDLPKASYQIFVRGYGLVDSPRQTAMPGQRLNLTATLAPDARAAAQVYPAAWWLSMISIPKGEMSDVQLTSAVKGCLNCHQIGNKATREIPQSIATMTKSSLEAWDHRTKMGPEGVGMGAGFLRLGAQRQMFADWTDRIAKGEAPKQAPPRPTGVERNLVVTVWDWGSAIDGRTDSTASDLRNPTVNANGPVYAASQSSDSLNVLDPVENRASVIKVPSTAPKVGTNPPESPYWGKTPVWERTSDPRSVAMDGQGRVWLTARTRNPQEQPAFCKGANKFGQYYPLAGPGGRQVVMYDPKTRQFTTIDTCFSADHNQIGRNNAIHFSGSAGAVGWVDITTFDKTKSAEMSQGWCPAVLDTNGDGKITPGWTEPKEAVDPKRDHRIEFGCYSPSVSPKDNSIWCSGIGAQDRKLVRIEKGSNPPETCKGEVFEAPPNVTPTAYGTGGIDIDDNGVVWQNWRGSGHFASFDRSKCKVTSGPTATGQSCPEGWTFYRATQPTYQNASVPINADESYLTQLDQGDVLGLGKQAPLYGSVNIDAMMVLRPQTKQFVTLRVPYPLGFFSRSAVGRIDDAKAGWKGKGLWSNFSNYAGWHIEGGKGALPKVVKFQMRPDPLAK